MSEKVVTILGTRPELIRLATLIPLLDEHTDHSFVHTGQNYNVELKDVFFEEFHLRKPDFQWDCSGLSASAQIGKILTETESLFSRIRPAKLLVLGDTNSALCAFVAKRMGVKVYHMEAGNRCFDDRVPEEINRRVVDQCSDVLMPYTHRSKENLLKEGIRSDRIVVTGNPIAEILQVFNESIERSLILGELNLGSRDYFLVTLHRAENVDLPERLKSFISAFENLHRLFNKMVYISVHPRTAKRLSEIGISQESLKEKGIITLSPLRFFDFVKLEKNAFCVLSDSGTVQEECCLFQVPTVTLRDVTERPETLDCGSNFLSGASSSKIINGVKIVTDSKNQEWKIPADYKDTNVSSKVLRALLGH